MLCMLIYSQKHTLTYPAVQTCAVLQARGSRGAAQPGGGVACRCAVARDARIFGVQYRGGGI